MSDWLLELRQVRKDYGALRPLRLRELRVAPGALVALVGLDAPAAEMFVNLVTGATLPDAGAVRVFGFDTAAITDGDEWLRTLDRFGILSDRAVLLDELTVAQNLAMTLTLAIDPIPPAVQSQIERLAQEVGCAPAGPAADGAPHGDPEQRGRRGFCGRPPPAVHAAGTDGGSGHRGHSV